MASLQHMRWFDRSQPQTLQMVVILLYLHVVFSLLGGTYSYFPWGLLATAASFAGAFGTANDKRWGYYSAFAAAILPFVFRLVAWKGFILVNGKIHEINIVDKITGRSVLNLIFEVALVALVLHPDSRNYQRIWFK
jgi:hypothetical protein